MKRNSPAERHRHGRIAVGSLSDRGTGDNFSGCDAVQTGIVGGRGHRRSKRWVGQTIRAREHGRISAGLHPGVREVDAPDIDSKTAHEANEYGQDDSGHNQGLTPFCHSFHRINP